MRKRKVDPIQLERLLRQGLTMEEAGKHFGCTKGTISKNAKALTFASAKDVVLRSASKINDKKINAMSRLEKISKMIQDEMEYTNKTMKTATGEERRNWSDIHLKHSAEIRKQIDLLKEIALTLYNIEEVEAFKKIVLEEIGGVDEEIREKILDRIRQRRASTGLAGIGGFGV